MPYLLPQISFKFIKTFCSPIDLKKNMRKVQFVSRALFNQYFLTNITFSMLCGIFNVTIEKLQCSISFRSLCIHFFNVLFCKHFSISISTRDFIATPASTADHLTHNKKDGNICYQEWFTKGFLAKNKTKQWISFVKLYYYTQHSLY